MGRDLVGYSHEVRKSDMTEQQALLSCPKHLLIPLAALQMTGVISGGIEYSMGNALS